MSEGMQRLLLAILVRAVRDLRNVDPGVRAEAYQWLAADPLCAEICEDLGYSQSALRRAVGLQPPPE